MRLDVLVTAADTGPGAVDELAERLAQAGMEVGQVLATIGVVSGSIDDSLLEAIRALPGVQAVEQQRAVQLPPPDADVQ